MNIKKQISPSFIMDENKFPMGWGVTQESDLPPKELEIYRLLDLVVTEWETDPTSVQCFDQMIIERAKKAVQPFRALRRLSST